MPQSLSHDTRPSAGHGHPSQQVTKGSAQIGASSPARSGPCFSCDEYGHRQVACPKYNGSRGLF